MGDDPASAQTPDELRDYLVSELRAAVPPAARPGEEPVAATAALEERLRRIDAMLTALGEPTDPD
ncbi:hypothetical protein [Micromonospora sp. WMMD714]|uniref:hypothetical protein n=1 Tax=Micromonospora sp. WMMD714 TaxID=3016097 RepID=UPI002499DD7E|nr:hypothetical protein [Micromonospora sp. WMMD714]WFE62971.1 hypothetical protein O7625_06570 [Micromonospora sp. WMMD714]